MALKNNVVQTGLRYFGGKAKLAHSIIPYLPDHHCWVDLFGGAANMTIAREPSKVEVFNDKDGDLINFYMMLRQQKEQLIEDLASLPTSRFLYETWLREEMPEDPYERAVRYFYLLRQSIIPMPNQPSGWRAGRVKNCASDYQSSILKLDSFEKRFRNVMIECLDYREIIKRYDGPEVFFFIDPPYVGRENCYKGGFRQEDHVELAEMLKHIEGKCLVTYYGDPLVLELYKDWNYVTLEAKVGSVVKASEGQKRRTETEYLFMNYSPTMSGQISFF
ncbi:DNA adenine methylase (plasmid) [Paenibacillus urinalis]|uniref:DNA adenine methylase n=1 Tax=Paenibacillus urinalis TaxID=521520 RepID=A0AAX3N9N2_9BACL|nr:MULTISPECIES: DNA adenine methylase [Paenibacillus]MCM3130545.1 DNA adenine methylase [Paenibacillus sp. MER 78]WDH85432.1 DNA adenine methylase [Paenibacillus urinalis]WDH95131.1 DNA adenine methylase [Paenibacillus urinalis]WDI05396.1 DNA adenine methylase [Paenibacillus urinalis]